MKQVLIAMTLCWCLAAGSLQAQGVQVVKDDSTGLATATVAMDDSLPDGRHRAHSMNISMNGHESAAADDEGDDDNALLGISLSEQSRTAVVIVLIVFGCCVLLPVLIVFISMRYRYKMRRDECLLAARALEKGQPLPESLFYPKAESDLRTKGIRNIFLGLGLALLLGFICGASLSTIGLFISLLGMGQVATYYTRPKRQAGSEADKTPQPQATAQAPSDTAPAEAAPDVSSLPPEHVDTSGK
ncbi:MAG: DUF6249 domain-containing protein [Prevotellaceae bacterium]|nr:DUF6249 domain-containing protein [Prevotellaceae bacterium]